MDEIFIGRKSYEISEIKEAPVFNGFDVEKYTVTLKSLDLKSHVTVSVAITNTALHMVDRRDASNIIGRRLAREDELKDGMEFTVTTDDQADLFGR